MNHEKFKKKMLEIETSLYLNGYFSNPKMNTKLAEDEKNRIDDKLAEMNESNSRMKRLRRKKEGE